MKWLPNHLLKLNSYERQSRVVLIHTVGGGMDRANWTWTATGPGLPLDIGTPSAPELLLDMDCFCA